MDKLFEEYKNISYENDDWVKKIEDIKSKYNVTLLDDVLYNDREWKKFDKWFKNYIEPFGLSKYEENINHPYSVYLWQDYFYYDWVKEKKIEPSYYGDGHCYNDLFKDYLEDKFSDLNDRLDYDSENGMFCVYCKNKHDAEQVSFELSKLYKDENKMIQLIKDTKEKYGYIFNTNISI